MLPLEDYFEDIIGKAQRGLNLSDAQIIAECGITADALSRAQAGTFEESTARKLAPLLHLDYDALAACGTRSWHPKITPPPPGMHRVVTDYKGIMQVNAYLTTHPDTRSTIIFDTGADASPILDIVQSEELAVIACLITHQHGDHVMGLDRIKTELAVPVFARESSEFVDRTFAWGDHLSLGGFQIECRQTTGHAPDGTTFFLRLRDQPVAMVGDALFAGSMGGADNHWQEALDSARNQILSLEDATLLCPGHGPLTTVGLEKVHNPFFAGRG